MTEQELAAIEARWKASTPGQWTVESRCGIRGDDPGGSYGYDIPELPTPWLKGMVARHADAAFIAAAHQDVPALIAALRHATADASEPPADRGRRE